MSKLIVNTGTLSAGGAERVLSVLSKPFADTFDEVQYVMWLDAKCPDIFYEIDPRVKIVKLSEISGSTSVWRHMLMFRRYVKKERPDLVLSFMVMIDFTVTVSLLGTGIKQVVAERNDPRSFKKKWLRKIINQTYLFPDVKGILMQTEWNRSYFKSKKLLSKTSVIYNPIDVEPKYVGAAVEARKEDVIVSVGRLTSQKNQTLLVNAFAEFHKTHPSYKLVIYGEGEERNNLVAKAETLGIKNSVFLPGRSTQVFQDILSAKLFVMTSLYEGMSNALVEAMCVGLPCISTKVSGATDLIKDGENGFLVDNDDIQSIIDKMSLLVDDETLSIRIGKNATKIYNLLNSNEVCIQWIDYLNALTQDAT